MSLFLQSLCVVTSWPKSKAQRNAKSSQPKKANSDFQEIVDKSIMVEHEVEEDNFFNCNCREVDKLISTHYCEQCDKGFCQYCVEVHQRCKETQLHNLQPINYYCKCHIDEKIWASKYCQECLEALCNDCVVAHERSSETKNHILKSV